MNEPRRFCLERSEDVTGLSGVGLVCWGVSFGDGVVVTRWNAEVAQTCVWSSMADLLHVHGHGGRTAVRWFDDEELPSFADAFRRALPTTEQASDRLARACRAGAEALLASGRTMPVDEAEGW